VLILLHVVNVISAFTKCYPVNDQEYCFYTDGSVLKWTKAREFCGSLGATLPIITDEDIDNVFQRFILDSNNTNNSTWLDAHARNVNDSDPFHWINGQPSGHSNYDLLSLKFLFSDFYCVQICMSVTRSQVWNSLPAAVRHADSLVSTLF